MASAAAVPPGRPQAGGKLDADGIGEAELCDVITEVGVVAVSRVGQYQLGVDPGRAGGTQLVKRDLRLGLEHDIIGHARLRAPVVGVIDPLMRQI